MFRRAAKPYDSPRRFNPSEAGADDSGMDIDQPSPNPHGRIADFAINDGPSRKRQHTDLGATVPFQSHPTGPVHRYDNNVPFIFYSNRPVPPEVPALPPFAAYGPSTWQGMNMDTFNTLPPPAVQDVEMEDSSGGAHGHGVHGEVSAITPAPLAVQEPVQHPKEEAQETPDVPKRKIATGALSRVKKRREKEWRRRDTDSEGEESSRRSRSIDRPLKSEHTYHHHHNLNAPGMRHSEIPALLLGYLQFFVNASIVLFILYLVGLFVMTVRRDVNDRMSEASIEIMQEIAECSQLYFTNRCDPTVRVPAMESACKAWDVCMHRDPTMIGRTNVMVETFASVINSFVEQISWRTMGFALVTLSFLVALANSALFNLRQNATPDHQASIIPPLYPSHPQHLPWMPAGQLAHAYGQPGQQQHSLPPGPGQSEGVRQIAWEEKKKGWLW